MFHIHYHHEEWKLSTQFFIKHALSFFSSMLPNRFIAKLKDVSRTTLTIVVDLWQNHQCIDSFPHARSHRCSTCTAQYFTTWSSYSTSCRPHQLAALKLCAPQGLRSWPCTNGFYAWWPPRVAAASTSHSSRAPREPVSKCTLFYP
jgi:hypothetical protein